MFLFQLINVLLISITFYTYSANIVFFMQLGLSRTNFFTLTIACIAAVMLRQGPKT